MRICSFESFEDGSALLEISVETQEEKEFLADLHQQLHPRAEGIIGRMVSMGFRKRSGYEIFQLVRHHTQE